MALPLARARGVRRAARAGRRAEIDEAKKKDPYTLSERQAKAILEMRLSRLTGLEHEKLAKEYGELCDAIARFRAILASPKLLDDVIVMELEEIRDEVRRQAPHRDRRERGRDPATKTSSRKRT